MEIGMSVGVVLEFGILIHLSNFGEGFSGDSGGSRNRNAANWVALFARDGRACLWISFCGTVFSLTFCYTK